MFEQSWRRESLTDAANLLLGVVLFLSPSLFGFVPEVAASWNAWLSGAAIAVLAIAALAIFAEWEEWLNLVVGVWVAVSPWLLGFSAHATAMRVHLVIGVIVALVAAARLWFERQNPPRVTA